MKPLELIGSKPIKGTRFEFKERIYVSLGIWSNGTFDYVDKENGHKWSTTVEKFDQLVRSNEITLL